MSVPSNGVFNMTLTVSGWNGPTVPSRVPECLISRSSPEECEEQLSRGMREQLAINQASTDGGQWTDRGVVHQLGVLEVGKMSGTALSVKIVWLASEVADGPQFLRQGGVVAARADVQIARSGDPGSWTIGLTFGRRGAIPRIHIASGAGDRIHSNRGRRSSRDGSVIQDEGIVVALGAQDDQTGLFAPVVEERIEPVQCHARPLPPRIRCHGPLFAGWHPRIRHRDPA